MCVGEGTCEAIKRGLCDKRMQTARVGAADVVLTRLASCRCTFEKKGELAAFASVRSGPGPAVEVVLGF